MPGAEYDIVLTAEPTGGYTVTVPDLPDVVTEGGTREEALTMAQDAIEGYLDTLRDHSWPVRRSERAQVAVNAE